MLYTKQINQITWDDVETFCQQQIAEGAMLDYKENFPNALENTIAAMANTLGGLILIGVKEDGQGKPAVPVEGINLERGLTERVMNIILTNITPPTFPDIQVCTDQSDSQAVVVIRIYESDAGPHAIAKNTRVYLRTHNQNKPEELAAIDEIEWLARRRQKCVDLRDALFEKASDHHRSLTIPNAPAPISRLGDRFHGTADFQITNRPLSFANLTLSLCPLYPRHQFAQPPNLNDLCKNISVRDYFGTDHTFPLPSQSSGRLLQDGVCIFSDKIPQFYTELNIFGLYFYAQSVVRERKDGTDQTSRLIRAPEVFCRVDEFLDSAEKWFDQIGYRGSLHYRANLKMSDDNRLVTYRMHSFDDAYEKTSLDKEIDYVEVIPAGSLTDDKVRWRLEPVQRICWSFDYNVTAQVLDHYYQKNKPRKL